jgi:glutaredoxin
VTTLKKFTLLMKPGCKNCEEVHNYLKTKAVYFEEWNVEEEHIINRLMNDPKFSQKFCDIEACYSSLPAIRLNDTGEYYYKEDLGDFKRFYALVKLLELE